LDQGLSKEGDNPGISTVVLGTGWTTRTSD